jgi:rare lipoprotein A
MKSTIREKCIWTLAGVILLMACAVGCSSKPPVVRSPAYEAVGLASFYGKKFNGRKTASGERFNMYALTAAHKRLAFGAMVRVTHLKNGRSVVVRINDRGPFAKDRIIDLSYAAAKKLGMVTQGVARVRIRVE